MNIKDYFERIKTAPFKRCGIDISIRFTWDWPPRFKMRTGRVWRWNDEVTGKTATKHELGDTV